MKQYKNKMIMNQFHYILLEKVRLKLT